MNLHSVLYLPFSSATRDACTLLTALRIKEADAGKTSRAAGGTIGIVEEEKAEVGEDDGGEVGRVLVLVEAAVIERVVVRALDGTTSSASATPVSECAMGMVSADCACMLDTDIGTCMRE